MKIKNLCELLSFLLKVNTATLLDHLDRVNSATNARPERSKQDFTDAVPHVHRPRSPRDDLVEDAGAVEPGEGRETQF